MTTPRRRTLDELDALAAEIVLQRPEGRVMIAVDGLAGSGSDEVADALAARLRIGSRAVFRASVTDFQRSRAARRALERDVPVRSYTDPFDYRTLHRVLVDPFRIGRIGSFVLRAFDVVRDRPFEPVWSSGPDDAWLILDGPFLAGPELRGLWDYRIWVETPTEPVSDAIESDAQYLAQADPAGTADAIIAVMPVSPAS